MVVGGWMFDCLDEYCNDDCISESVTSMSHKAMVLKYVSVVKNLPSKGTLYPFFFAMIWT